MKFLLKSLLLISVFYAPIVNAEEICIAIPECYKARTLKFSFLKLSEQSPFIGGYFDKHYTTDGLISILGDLNNKYAYQNLSELVDYYFGDMALNTLKRAILRAHDKKFMSAALKYRLTQNAQCTIPDSCQSVEKRNQILKELAEKLEKNEE